MKIEVGKTWFRDSYADGRPKFVVRKDMGNGLYLCISEDIDYSGIERYFSAEQIRSKVSYEQNLERVFTDKDDWWEAQTVGAVLHYHNGFGQFVRGIVVLRDGKKQLLPQALVGNWSKSDLPQRLPNGEIRYGYQVEKIREGRAWQPHESCVVESGKVHVGTSFTQWDPHGPELDLSVPDMTEDEQTNAVLERKIERVREVLENRWQNDDPPAKVLEHIIRAAQGSIR